MRTAPPSEPCGASGRRRPVFASSRSPSTLRYVFRTGAREHCPFFSMFAMPRRPSALSQSRLARMPGQMSRRLDHVRSRTSPLLDEDVVEREVDIFQQDCVNPDLVSVWRDQWRMTDSL